jgi:voltage-gated potassium channel
MSHPSNDAAIRGRWFESAMQLLVVYSIAGYYAEAELSEAGYITAGSGFWLWNERVIACLFSCEYLARWMTAKNRLRYPVSLLAIIDLVAILPFYVGLVVDFRSLKLIRTLRILRLFKLYRHNRALQNVLYGFRRVKDELTVIGFVVIIVIMFSAVAMYEFEHEAQPKAFARLSDAIWWAIITLTTVGYGDIYPITIGGRLIAILTMIIGTGIFGTFISLIGSSFVATMREEANKSPHRHRRHLPIAPAKHDAPSDVSWFDTALEDSKDAA